MAKGAGSKLYIENKLREAFGKNFIAVVDKKCYINAPDDDGTMVQVAVSMTCPKVPIGATPEGGIDFDNMPSGGSATEFKPAEITTEETENIRKMLAELGL